MAILVVAVSTSLFLGMVAVSARINRQAVKVTPGFTGQGPLECFEARRGGGGGAVLFRVEEAASRKNSRDGVLRRRYGILPAGRRCRNMRIPGIKQPQWHMEKLSGRKGTTLERYGGGSDPMMLTMVVASTYRGEGVPVESLPKSRAAQPRCF